MKHSSWVGVALVFCLGTPTAEAFGKHVRLAGQVDDYTRKLGRDRRIWSSAMDEYRDLIVYRPPGFDPCQQYPVLLYLHGIGLDEQDPADNWLEPMDRAICAGCLPPMIIAIPDGSPHGRPRLFGHNTFFINSKLGCFEDFIERDVWNFLVKNYPIRPERGAHAVVGYSSGGTASYFHGIRYRDRFGVVAGMSPPLNLRWLDCHGRYFSDFDPDCWGWRESVRPGHQVVGRFYGVVTFRLGQFVYPLFGRGPDAVAKLSAHNPIEMLDCYDVKPGDFAMYISYGGRDEFNVTAQVDSFLFKAQQRGLHVHTFFDPRGRHNWPTVERAMPDFIRWLGPWLAPYGPPLPSSHPQR